MGTLRTESTDVQPIVMLTIVGASPAPIDQQRFQIIQVLLTTMKVECENGMTRADELFGLFLYLA